MPRKIITEFKAKELLFSYLGFHYQGISFEIGVDSLKKFEDLNQEKSYVIKVDQGVKKRKKRGLIFLDVKPRDIKSKIWQLKNQGFRRFLIEEFIPHFPEAERYLSIEREREGYLVLFSERGGVEIEENANQIKKFLLPYEDFSQISFLSQLTKTPEAILKKIFFGFDQLYFSFLEANPFLSEEKFPFFPLDLAVEVDSAGEFFVGQRWQKSDFIVDLTTKKTPEEQNIINLQEKSSSSFKLTVLNDQGSIFLLLAGGGASLVLADEIFHCGLAKEIANYGEYSGNPTEEETYLYTKNLISLLLKSKAKKKFLIIGGGVANFTDVRTTFSGIVRALTEEKEKLKKENLKVFVRRGGPNEKEGLALMKEFLEKEGFLGKVAGSELVLTDIVRMALSKI